MKLSKLASNARRDVPQDAEVSLCVEHDSKVVLRVL